MSELKEYVVTLKNFDDLEAFYEDMETPGGDLYIPNREVDIALRRPISRSTHYYLTKEEAEQLINDSRVLSVELLPAELGIIVRPAWVDSSDFWDKSGSNVATHKNWALLRCVEGIQRNNWGSNGTTSQTGIVQVNAEGRNVDVVIVDGFINPAHPEMAVNSDGTGGSRVVQYNWLQHAQTPGSYLYTTNFTGADNNHGQHVAGTVAGNTQGWARKANIYNYFAYASDPNGLDVLVMYDYIRAWHASKPINPITGRKNPTIVNNSWGYGYMISIANITKVNHRGVDYNTGLTSAFLNSLGIINNGSTTDIPARYSALEQDQLDAINEGIIVVGAAGNDSMKIDVIGGIDYDNYLTYLGSLDIGYHQGMAPTAGTLSICVGSIGATATDTKANYSNCGPRIDIYAPGSSIMSSVHTGGVSDLRSSGTQYYQQKYNGTSMASPQVCGVLACLLEVYPEFNQTQIINYLNLNSKYNQITDTAGSYTDFTSLQGSTNKYLYYKKERSDIGKTWPKLNYLPRPASGRMFPRVKVRR
jgi:hypothetical protein